MSIQVMVRSAMAEVTCTHSRGIVTFGIDREDADPAQW